MPLDKPYCWNSICYKTKKKEQKTEHTYTVNWWPGNSGLWY